MARDKQVNNTPFPGAGKLVPAHVERGLSETFPRSHKGNDSFEYFIGGLVVNGIGIYTHEAILPIGIVNIFNFCHTRPKSIEGLYLSSLYGNP